MKSQSELDWPTIRGRAAMFPEEAFQFVREGLQHTAKAIHGEAEKSAAGKPDHRRHVSGQQLCLGLRDMAVQRYGLLALAVLGKWGLRRTEDFGTIVYAMIDRGELRSSDNDSLDDFKDVYAFGQAFMTPMAA